MLFKQATLQAIAAGKITVAFRRWRRPTVRAGGTLKTAVGVLAISAVDRIALRDITARDAKAAGFASPAEIRSELSGREGVLHRVRFRLAGEDPRIALRARARMTAAELAEVREQLVRWDRASRSGPWTSRYLALISKHVGVRAGDLADQVGLERLRFKTNVRKLKSLGLTESLKVGYRLSPRGTAVLRALE